MAAIIDTAVRHDLAVVEDAAHAFGASYRGRPVGAVDPRLRSQATCFSLYVTKNITTGEGGVLTGRQELVDRAREWSLHGMNRDAWRRYGHGGSWRYDVVHPGFKYNLTDLQAALGLAQLRKGRMLHERRADIAARYSAAFADLDELQVPTASDDVDHAWHLYVLRLNLDQLDVGRDEFIDEVVSHGIGVSVHFIPLHLHTYYRERYGWRGDEVPVADSEFERLVSLPIWPRMSDCDVEDVIAAVRDVVTRHSRPVAR
jgi:dTDP-4-amino-4,6-dideoxygalactose transaminase